jgi:2-polyprenyl-6-methoxyphenol hydroxylase-like FAD-dependent oxidoreductase
MPDVVIVGAGPVGTLLAGLLTRDGADVELLERRPTPGAGTRAIGLHATTLERLEASGITDEILASALRVGRGEARADGRVLGTVRFDRLSRRFPFVATLPQSGTERILAGRAPAALRGAVVTAVKPSDTGVTVRANVAGHITERTAPLVVVATGASGRGLVFRADATPTTHYPDRYLMSDAPAAPGSDPGVAVVNLAPGGVLESFPLPGGQRLYVAWVDSSVRPDDDHAEARLARLRQAMVERGEPVAAGSLETATSFGVRRFVSPQMRHGRLFAIGDTAHEVSPIGGQGMNLGLIDAATLAPLLTQWLRTGAAPEAELASWEQRRVASARTSAFIAALNTRLGRELPAAAHRLRALALRGALAPGPGTLFAHAYAMGFDRDR